MSKHREIIKEIENGNGNKFTVKEILQAHVRDNRDAHKAIFQRLQEGEGILSSLKTWRIAYGFAFVIIFTALIYIVF